MCSLLPYSLVRLYIYLIIDYSLLACFHSFISLLISIPLSLNPLNPFKDFPRPPPAGSSSSANLMLVPPPPGVGGAGVDDDCVADVNDWSGRGCGVRAAHSPLGLFAIW